MEFTQRLPQPCPQIIDICQTLSECKDEEKRMLMLMKYRSLSRSLSGQIAHAEQTTKQLQVSLAEAQWAQWAANQEQLKIKSEIELYKRSSQSLSQKAEAIDGIQQVMSHWMIGQDRGQVMDGLSKEKEAKIILKDRVEQCKQKLQTAKDELDRVKMERRQLKQSLASLTSSTQCLAVKELISKTLHLAAEHPSIKPLNQLFDQLANAVTDPLPWEQLRFFPASILTERGEGEDMDETVSDQDQIRLTVSGECRLTIYMSENKYAIKMDPVDGKFTDEQAEQWIQSIITSTPDIYEMISRICTVWRMEKTICEELLIDTEFSFNRPHNFTFTLKACNISLTTCPLSWRIDVVKNDDEAFVTRCRLVQDRLNSADMISSPFSLQFAFLHKLL